MYNPAFDRVAAKYQRDRSPDLNIGFNLGIVIRETNRGLIPLGLSIGNVS